MTTRITALSIATVAIIAMALLLGITALWVSCADRRGRAVRRAQTRTVTNIRSTDYCIKAYMQKHGGRLPRTMKDLVISGYILSPGYRDGWGRELVYRTSGDRYMLASYGHSGLPDDGLACPDLAPGPARWTDWFDAEADIVLCDGEFVQLPELQDNSTYRYAPDREKLALEFPRYEKVPSSQPKGPEKK